MALQALQSSGVGLRRILAHFPEDLSLAFAYGSAVYRQAGPNAHQEVSPRPPAFPPQAWYLPGRPRWSSCLFHPRGALTRQEPTSKMFILPKCP